jgi:hypothetical protein
MFRIDSTNHLIELSKTNIKGGVMEKRHLVKLAVAAIVLASTTPSGVKAEDTTSSKDTLLAVAACGAMRSNSAEDTYNTNSGNYGTGYGAGSNYNSSTYPSSSSNYGTGYGAGSNYNSSTYPSSSSNYGTGTYGSGSANPSSANPNSANYGTGSYGTSGNYGMSGSDYNNQNYNNPNNPNNPSYNSSSTYNR